MTATLEDETHWYKDAIIYELHVRAFCDDNDDGYGDFRGLVTKLDYLQDLGVTALWLLPFYPSPLKDDGYDIADYKRVHPAYGDLRSFRRFLREAHRRGLRIITELVINHTSTEHPWFQRARRAAPGTPERDYYVWTDNPQKYADTRIIFQDFETSNWAWDPVARAYYWHRFYSHQPDLNFDNPLVREAVLDALDFWMEMGVDGMRLDAVPYLYEREGTNCENLPETHAFLKELRAYIDSKYEDRMLLAEANQWPEDAAAYFGDGDECHMNFHFPAMPRLFMAVQLESAYPIVDILEQTPAIPNNCQWALFLRNHDELTLEMVTDEDRDYMYRVYAADPRARVNVGIRRRLAPLLGGRRQVELLNALLMSLPGTPVLYYGDEIGMGDNVYLGDRNGVRTPMQWSSDRNAGFSRCNPQQMYLPPITDPEYHYEAVNVEAHQNNPSSLLWWMKRLIALRRQSNVFGRGDLRFVRCDSNKVVAFVRSLGEERVLVVANLSRYVQYVHLDLNEYRGAVPREMFGHTEFPAIGESFYPMSLGPHGFFWLALEQATAEGTIQARPLPSISVQGNWQKVLDRPSRPLLDALKAYIREQIWYRSGTRKRKGVRISEVIALDNSSVIAFVELLFVDGSPETYVLPLSMVRSTDLDEQRLRSAIALLDVQSDGKSTAGTLVDATANPDFADKLLAQFGRRSRTAGRQGRLMATAHRRMRRLRRWQADLTPHPPSEQSNSTCMVYGDRVLLKLLRVLEPGTNSDLEINQHLERVRYGSVPAMLGSLDYEAPKTERCTLVLARRYVPAEGTARRLWNDAAVRFYDSALSRTEHPHALMVPANRLLDAAQRPTPPIVEELIGTMQPIVRLLATRTAELHLALASNSDDPAFAAERFSQLHRRSLYQSALGRQRRAFELLHSRHEQLPQTEQALAAELLARQQKTDAQLRRIVSTSIDATRIRCHGDLHLGHIIFTGKDFTFVDFAGEARRAISERRFKTSPLRDVASLLRSSWEITTRELDVHRREDRPLLELWGAVWRGWLSVAFLRVYLEATREAAFVPASRPELETLLNFYLLDYCITDLRNNLSRTPYSLGATSACITELVNL